MKRVQIDFSFGCSKSLNPSFRFSFTTQYRPKSRSPVERTSQKPDSFAADLQAVLVEGFEASFFCRATRLWLSFAVNRRLKSASRESMSRMQIGRGCGRFSLFLFFCFARAYIKGHFLCTARRKNSWMMEQNGRVKKGENN